jgi:predicted DsbA family dithiol-disulfide isomerase
MTRSFAITFDYLCPFARIANETVVAALDAGLDWEVEFRPFSLSQTKVEEGGVAAWERPLGAEGTRGVLALAWGIAVRDEFPDHFRGFHVALYDARFADTRDIEDEAVLRDVASAVGLDADAVAAHVGTGIPIDTLAREHAELVKRWAVFGVPTFISGDEAVFVRLMERDRRDDVERVLDMLEWTDLNEFKRTRVPR